MDSSYLPLYLDTGIFITCEMESVSNVEAIIWMVTKRICEASVAWHRQDLTFDCLIMRGDQRTNRISAWSKPCVTSYFTLALLSFLPTSLSIQHVCLYSIFSPLERCETGPETFHTDDVTLEIRVLSDWSLCAHKNQTNQKRCMGL